MNAFLLKLYQTFPRGSRDGGILYTLVDRVVMMQCKNFSHGTLKFSYIRRLGSFFGVQNFEFQFFWGVFRKINIFWV